MILKTDVKYTFAQGNPKYQTTIEEVKNHKTLSPIER